MTNLQIETLALHGGYDPQEHQRASNVPIYQTAAYEYQSANQAADLFALKQFGNMYSRITNPTNEILEKRMTALESGIGALALSSGTAAQFIAITTIARKGDNIISSAHLYGGTYTQFKYLLNKFDIEVRFFDPQKPELIEKLVDNNTKAVFIESIGNPKLDIPEFEIIGNIAKKIQIPLIVDNTFATPALFQPLLHGANIVVHSLTKYCSGGATSLGGIIIDGGNFDWSDNAKFACLNKPDPAYHDLIFTRQFSNSAYIVKARVEGLRDIGACLSPQNAFYIIKGLETLPLRMERHCENALKLAQYLEKQQEVAKVNYPWLPFSDEYQKAQKYFPRGCGGMLTFELKKGIKAGKKFLENVQIAQHQTNVGDNKTIVTHPASTTHQQLSSSEQLQCGVTPGLVRVAVGIENIQDLIDDFNQAIEKSSN